MLSKVHEGGVTAYQISVAKVGTAHRLTPTLKREPKLCPMSRLNISDARQKMSRQLSAS